MYVIHDRLTPHIQEYTHSSMVKNTIMNRWPRITISNTVCMDRLFLFIRGSGGVQDTPAHRKIYKLLNTKIEDLHAQDWDGIASYWLEWKPLPTEAIVLSNAAISSYILGNINDTDWIVTQVVYQPQIGIVGYNSDSDIIAVVSDPYNSALRFALIDENDNWINNTLALAIIDVDNIIFEKTMVVLNSVLTKAIGSQTIGRYHAGQTTTSSRYIQSAVVEVRYKLKEGIDWDNPSIVGVLSLISQRALSIDNPSSMSKLPGRTDPITSTWLTVDTINSRESSINKGLIRLLEVKTDYSEDPRYITGISLATAGHYITESSLLDMPPVEFVKFMMSSITTGYKEKKASLIETFIAVALGVLLIVLSNGVATGHVLAAWTGIAVASFSFTVLGAFALTLSIGLFILTAVAYVAAEKGYTGFAAYLNKVIAILGVVSTVVSVVNIFNAITTTLAKQVVLEGAKTAAGNTAKDVAIKEIANVTISDIALSDITLSSLYETGKSLLFDGSSTLMGIFNKVVSAVDWVFSFYSEHEMKALQGDLAAQQATLDAQSAELKQYEGRVDKVMYQTSDLYDGYYNPYFSEFELGTGEGYDRYHKTATHWKCQNSIDWVFPT